VRTRLQKIVSAYWQRVVLEARLFWRPPIVEFGSGFRPLSNLDRPQILVLKLDHIGDFVLGLSAMSELRTAWPRATITLVCASWNVDLAARTKLFDAVVAYDFFEEISDIYRKPSSERYTRFQYLKLDKQFDIAIDLRHDGDTRPFLNMVQADFRAGYTAPDLETPLDLELPVAEFRANHGEYLHRHSPDAELRLVMLVQAVIARFRNSGNQVMRRLAEEPSDKAVRPQGRYIVVCSGAGKSTRKWPLHKLVALCVELIATTDSTIAIVGGEGDCDDARAIADALPPDRCRDYTGKVPIPALTGLLSNAHLFIGYDSGVTHIAAQLNVRTICLFSGASDARIWKPHGANVTIVKANIVCSPCYIIRRKDCPVGVRCMEIISVADAMKAVHRVAPAP
jgi:ADP-heptose:LPS heptosyltransferase